MDELKLLVDMVSDLPHMALWVIAAFFAYKVIIVGSIYGVIRFIASGIFSVIQAHIKKEPAPVILQTKEGFGFVRDDDLGELQELLRRVRRNDKYGLSEYLHSRHINRLSKALDFYEAHEAQKAKKAGDAS